MASSPLRSLFFAEGVLKVVGGSVFFFSPSIILRNLVEPPFCPIQVSLIRILGTQTLAFSIPLLLASRSDIVSVRSRRIVYWTLLAREGLLGLGLMVQLAWSYLHRGGRESVEDNVDARALEEGQISDKRARKEDRAASDTKLRGGLWLWVAELAPFVMGRLWILTRRGEWFLTS